ncbi:ABC transporter substrate-binding protein [Cohnella candidum]|uniref:Sugar ABC transporter substrate-binding protein n=1 Tax=Cohnella candidum TaxID=2674991 RepID=A0A3G3K360_9BACL|nr:sugar ABC transporter substrate-binding protein [Cohnella candidum]AYQ74913.1 sugar ABC transporter substrate-binding protein [Cohnella candidum]
MRKTLGILLAVMLMVSLAACGGSKSGTASESASPSGSAPASPASSNSGEANLKQFEGTTLNVLMKTGYTAQAITDYQSEFEAATGIKLNVEVVDEPTTRKKFILDSTTKQGAYDVIATEFWYMPEFLKLQSLEPLDDYIANKKSPWLSVDDMPQGLKDTYKGTDGKLYSLPVTASGGVLMYRKDLFDQYGIAKPATTADVLAAAKTLKEKLPADVVPFIGRGESSSASFGSTAGWAWAYGASVLDAGGNVTVNSDAMKQAVGDWVTLMKDYGPKDAAAMGWDTMSEVFRQGKAAMNFDMSGFPSVYDNPQNSQVAGKVDTAIITGPANHAAQWMFGEGLAISANSKNKDAAWLFLQWRTSLEVAEKEAADKIRVDFPLDSVYDSAKYQEATKDQPFAKQIQDVMKSIDTTYWPNVAEFDQLGQALQQEIALAIAGKQDVSAALDKAQASIQKILKK